ncbi:MAG: hypothetical protein ABI680_04265, partial [Chthoniobacteraceae bacterium]
EDMEALAEFAGKLAERYRPGGTLARLNDWGETFGVRAWELENEPESYLTNWKGQAGDFAEYATRAAAKIKAADTRAVILLPGMAGGRHGLDWLRETLDARALAGSPAFRKRGRPYSIGPVADVVSFHNYEGLDSAFAGGSRTITHVFSDVRAIFEEWENRAPGFTWSRKQEYWHTEGSFDFIGALSAERRAAWRFQFFTRAFAAGIRKVVVMDPSPEERIAVKAYVAALPDPFPMHHATDQLRIESGKAAAFIHADDDNPAGGRVWIVWALADSGDAVIKIPVLRPRVSIVNVEGRADSVVAENGRVRVTLRGDEKMPAPLLVIDR